MTRLKDWRYVVALGALGWAVLYAGRAVLSPALAAIGREWRLGEGRLGALSSGFFLGYAAMQIPTGLLADRWGRKGILVGGLVAFAAATVLRGMAPTYGFLLGASILAGLAQGTYYATMFGVTSAVVPAERRSLGSAIVYGGMAVGTSGGFLLGSFVTAGFGWDWRAPFLLLAAPTLTVALLCAFLPPEQPRPPELGVQALVLSGTPVPKRTGVRPAGSWTVLTPRLVRAYFLNFTSLYAFFMLLTWLPFYLQDGRGLAATEAALASSLAPWASIPSGLVVGLVSDRRGDRIGPLRVLLPGAALAVLGISLAATGPALYGALLVYGLLGKSATDPLLVAEVAELAPAGRSATALSLLNFSGMIASVAAPYVTGVLAHAYGDMRPAFYVAAGILLAGSAVSGFGPRKRPGCPQPTPPSRTASVSKPF